MNLKFAIDKACLLEWTEVGIAWHQIGSLPSMVSPNKIAGTVEGSKMSVVPTSALNVSFTLGMKMSLAIVILLSALGCQTQRMAHENLVLLQENSDNNAATVIRLLKKL